jgi:hypothetical protein
VQAQWHVQPPFDAFTNRRAVSCAHSPTPFDACTHRRAVSGMEGATYQPTEPRSTTIKSKRRTGSARWARTTQAAAAFRAGSEWLHPSHFSCVQCVRHPSHFSCVQCVRHPSHFSCVQCVRLACSPSKLVTCILLDYAAGLTGVCVVLGLRCAQQYE